MPKHNLRKHNLRERERDPGTGRYLSQCSCINHDEWSFNHIYTELNKKTIKKFGKRYRSANVKRWNTTSVFKSIMHAMLSSL